MLTFCFSGADGRMTQPEVLTTGMIGKQVKLEFTSDWDGLIKTAVFSDGKIIRDAVIDNGAAVIPAEVLTVPLRQFTLGVYGVGADGELVIPTIRAKGPRILPGVDPSGDEGTDPTLPIWAQIRALIGDLDELDTEATENLVAAINELVPTRSDAAAALAAANSAVEISSSAQEAAAEAKAAASNALSTVDTAQATADNAHAAAEAAQASADNAQSTAEAAQSAADSAQSAAEAAQTAADEAQSTASSAKSTASTASTRANSALASAAQAQSQSNNAVSKANNAQTSADNALALAQTKLDAEGITTETIVATKADGSTVTLTVLVST